MSHDLALARMVLPVAGVKETTLNGDESVVEAGFEGTVSVTVDDGQSVW